MGQFSNVLSATDKAHGTTEGPDNICRMPDYFNSLKGNVTYMKGVTVMSG